MKKLILIITFLIALNAAGDTNVPEYFESLYSRYSGQISIKYYSDYNKIVQNFDLKKENIENRKVCFQLMFFHELFTGKYCIDFSRGGVFRIPYVFHWRTPNPRHDIISLVHNKKLSSVSSSREFNRYKSFADIDRVPSLYIGDLFSGTPKYYHPDCGKFYTFGWCSEREMAFNALLTLLGYTCKIKQQGIHTWSEVWLNFKNSDGGSVNAVMIVDNSVDIIEWEKVPAGLTMDKWLKDYGEGTQINWYNKKARSKSELEKLKNRSVKETQVRWIEKSVCDWLGL